jgi:pterin-4a-carbinolamine dehydratase
MTTHTAGDVVTELDLAMAAAINAIAEAGGAVPENAPG